jgi:hypothetical protein
MDVWVERELDGCEFPDRRLKARLGKLLGDLGRRIGGTVPAACQDWAATKAAYRFFSNPRVDEGIIPAGHFAATAARFAATAGMVLVLHDTTEFSFTRDTPHGVGQLSFVEGRHVIDTPTVRLMDPFRTRDEAEREAAAVGGWGRNSLAPPQDWCDRTEYLPGLDSPSPGRNNS